MTMTRRAASCIAVLAALTAAPAWAADEAPPVITHVRVTQAPKGQALTIRARIEDASEIFAPSVYVRPKGARDYDNIGMRKVLDAYEALVPAEQVDGDLQYFIEAFDEHGNGPAREGSPEEPIEIEVYDPKKGPPGGVVAVPPPPPPPDVVPPPPPVIVVTPQLEVGVTRTWWFWTIIGGVVVAGAATAAVLATRKSPVDFVDIEVVGPDPTGGL
ncbi:MAG: hypothetical protein KC933_26375 [Myxococcales bacterium]|nr:hypothetical protein [Myxococcales bacterium]MCB9652114.1 hypothetical protein [Deltaproteobacteria bacterium]